MRSDTDQLSHSHNAGAHNASHFHIRVLRHIRSPLLTILMLHNHKIPFLISFVPFFTQPHSIPLFVAMFNQSQLYADNS